MATVSRPTREIPLSEYPTGDGKPMAETPVHRKIMTMLIECLEDRNAQDPMVYVSGNMIMYYVQNDKRRHVSPDVFFVRGIPNTERKCYFVWEEGKGPDAVFEISSAATRKTDTSRKFPLYQDILRVPEYFLFDPFEEYLSPSLQGYRIRKGVYMPIKPVGGRLYSQELDLNMGRHDWMLRFYDPQTGAALLNWKEQRHEESLARARAEAEKQQLAASLRQAEEGRLAAEREQERLRREVEELRRRPKKRS